MIDESQYCFRITIILSLFNVNNIKFNIASMKSKFIGLLLLLMICVFCSYKSIARISMPCPYLVHIDTTESHYRYTLLTQEKRLSGINISYGNYIISSITGLDQIEAGQMPPTDEGISIEAFKGGFWLSLDKSFVDQHHKGGHDNSLKVQCIETKETAENIENLKAVKTPRLILPFAFRDFKDNALFNASNNLLLAWSDEELRLMDFPSCRLTKLVKRENQKIKELHLNEESGHIAILYYDQQIEVLSWPDLLSMTKINPSDFSIKKSFLAPKGSFAALLDQTGKIQVIDLPSSQRISQFINPYEPLNKIAFDHQGNHLACIGKNEVEIRSVKDGSVIAQIPFRHGNNWTEDALFSNSGKEILLFTKFGDISLFSVDGTNQRMIDSRVEDLVLMDPIFSLKNRGPIDQCIFSHDDETILLFKRKRLGPFAELISTKDGSSIHTFSGHEFRGADLVSSVHMSPEGSYLISCGNDEVMKLWDLITGEWLGDFNNKPGWVRSLTFSNDINHFVTYSADIGFNVWDVQKKSIVNTISSSIAQNRNICDFKNIGDQLIFCGTRSGITILDLKSGVVKNINQINGESLNHIGFEHADEKILSFFGESKLVIINKRNGEIEKVIDDKRINSRLLKRAFLSPDGKIAYLTYHEDESDWHLWDIENEEIISHEYSTVHADEIDWEGKFIKHFLEGVALVDLRTNEQLDFIGLDSTHYPIFSRFSRNRDRIVVTLSNGNIKVLEYPDLRVIFTIDFNDKNLNPVLFTESGQYLVTIHNGVVFIWDAQNGKEVWSIDIPDGYYLTASRNNTLEIWTLNDTIIEIDAETGKSPIKSAYTFVSNMFDYYSPKDIVLIKDSEGNFDFKFKSEIGLPYFDRSQFNNTRAYITEDDRYLIVKHQDKSFSLWDTSNGIFLFRLYMSKTGDWLVHDEEYRVDGNEDVLKQLYFQCENKFVSFEKGRSILHIPGLAGIILRGEKVGSPGVSDLELCKY
jgi:WD40 repeat protein